MARNQVALKEGLSPAQESGGQRPLLGQGKRHAQNKPKYYGTPYFWEPGAGQLYITNSYVKFGGTGEHMFAEQVFGQRVSRRGLRPADLTLSRRLVSPRYDRRNLIVLALPSRCLPSQP